MKLLIVLFWSLTLWANDGVYDTFRSYCSPINLKTNRLYTTISFYQKQFVRQRIPFRGTFIQDRNGHIIKAPIVYIIPGSFAEIQGENTQNLLKLLNNLGMHAVLFPHPWSPDIVKARVNYIPGDLEKESSIMVEMIRFVEKNYAQYIIPGQNSLMGISSGATLALALAAKNQRQPFATQFNRVVLLSPPIDLHHSITRIDKMYSEVNRLARSINVVSLYKAYKGICASYTSEDYQLVPQYPYFSQVTKAIFSYFVFVREFQKMLISLDSYDNFRETSHYDGFLTEEILRYPTLFSIEKTYQKRFPKVYNEMKNRTGKLSYWLLQVDRVEIISAENDPINEGISWDGVSHLAGNFTLLKSGGHFGFRNMILPLLFPQSTLTP